jgi:hypothetical protein
MITFDLGRNLGPSSLDNRKKEKKQAKPEDEPLDGPIQPQPPLQKTQSPRGFHPSRHGEKSQPKPQHK